MILGRSTVQWTGLIVATLGLIQILAQVLYPDAASSVAIVLAALGSVACVYVSFLANTATTPISSPQLKAGTEVAVLDAAGKTTGDTVTVMPTPPGPVGHEG